MNKNKKKGVIKRLHPSRIFNFLRTYFFCSSWWIANLGVDPCWRFLALRRAPMFLWRLARLFSVTLVLETITQLRLSDLSTLTKRRLFLPLGALDVKRFVLLACIFSSFSKAALSQEQSLFMAIGEHIELKVPNLKEFSVSNNDTLSNKYRPSQAVLLLRGKKQGHAEVVVWNKAKAKQVWNIYVLSKSKHMQWIERLQALSDLGLKATTRGRLVTIDGLIENKNQWLAFRDITIELEKQKDLSFINQVKASPQLEKENLSEIYFSFLSLHADDVECSKTEQGPWINCLLSITTSQRKEVQELISELKTKHFLKTISSVESTNFTNYRLSIHLFKLEKVSSLQTDLTLEKAAGSLANLNRKDLISLAKNDDFNLGEERFHLKTLADPTMVVRYNKDFEFQMGSDIPYQSTDQNQNPNTSFRFAGLKINGSLTKSPIGPILDYKIELSAPANEGAIIGNKKSSSVLIRLDQDISIFKLNFTNQGIDRKSLPYLGDIPALGALFSSHEKFQEEKIIIGKIKLERVYE